MAEGLLRQELPKLTVYSAGLSALVGQPADIFAREAMESKGVDIGAHRAQQLTSPLCSMADLVLVMDRHQRRVLEGMYPSSRGKVFSLLEGVDIFDPYRMEKEKFVSCMELIETGVNAWVERIRKITG